MREKDIMLCSAAEIEEERQRVLQEEGVPAAVRRRRAGFLESLAEIVRFYEGPFRAKEWVSEHVRWEDWASLRPQLVEFTRGEMRRRRWRGKRGGLLPGGYSAADLADYAIGELLAGRGWVAVGFTRERLMGELKRLVSSQVRVLHKLKEARATRSEWEAGPRPVSVFDELADPAGERARAAVEREELRGEILDYLNGEAAVKEVFGCLWEGIRKPAEIAQRLGMDEGEVRRVRKRLERRLAGFARHKELGGDGKWDGKGTSEFSRKDAEKRE